MKKRRMIKIVKISSTLAVIAVGFAPSIFRIPAIYHPWLFLASIVWIVIFSSGVFGS